MHLAVKLPFASPEEFLQKYGLNLSAGGIYLRSKALKAPGTEVTLDLKLADGRRLFHANAVVAFVTGNKGEGVLGMGLKFLALDPEGKRFLDSAAAAMPFLKSMEVPVPKGVGPTDSSPEAVAPPPPPPTQANTALPSEASGRMVVGGSTQQITAPAFEPFEGEPKRDGPIIGIDLGTTNSCAAYVKDGKPQVLRSREGHNTVPSIVALNARGKITVGHPAKGQLLTNPLHTVYGSKRLIGRVFDSDLVKEIRDRFAWEVAGTPSGAAGARFGDQIYTLEQIAALILREVREVAQQQLATPISRAVITVPAWYNDNQRQAVREAGRLAGIHVERIVNEPTAAALAYGWGRKLSQRILVYDLGGGTFDASVLELNDSVYEVISTGGDTFLGGIDFDNAIVAHLLEEFAAKNGQKFQGDRVAMSRVTDAAERAKCQLSERTEVRVHVPFLTLVDGKPLDLDVTLTRDKLVALTYPLVERSLNVCKEVLAAKNLQPSDIQEVILVGGQSRAPLVHEQITAMFGKPPSKSVHPDEAVALGAGLLASSLGTVDGVTLIDVLPMSIGVGIPGGRFRPVIPRNSPLPAKRTHLHRTTRDDQSELELTVYQGSDDLVSKNELLGTVKMTGLPKGPRGSVTVTVTFEVTAEALLKLQVREDKSGREVSVVLNTKDTPDAVRKRLEAEGAQDPENQVVTGPSTAVVEPAAEKKGFWAWLKGLF